ncbi:aryl-sulfate sulfotransferase [Planctomycetota bacterium]
MKTKHYMATGALIACLVASSAYSQAFWSGNTIADFLDPNTADAYHDFLVEIVLPEARNASRQGNNNPENDTGVTIYDPDRCWNGYTLLSSQSGHQPDPNGPLYMAILVDMEGNLVKEWALEKVPMKMIPGGYVWGAAPKPGGGRALTLVDWDGNILWQVDRNHHHDFQVEGNPVGYYVPGMESTVEGGKCLILGKSNPDPNLTAHISEFPLKDDTLWELDADGNVLWQWKAWEHFEQMGFDDAAKDTIRTVRVGGGGTTDWTHGNAAAWLGPNKWYDQGDLRFHPENVIISLRTSNITAIVARYDHPDGDWVSGDIVWRVGPNYSAGTPEHKIGQIIGQHHSHVIPQGLPGAGNILIFDNGTDAGFGAVVPGLVRGTYPNTLSDFSRVVEFNPITMDLVWEYKQQHPTEDLDADGDIKGSERKFVSARISGAQRLENGNTLICEGRTGRVFEVTPEGDMVWEYISPYTGPIDAQVPRNNVYRAYRVPASWIP